jgi:hypothetical protein
MGLLYFIGPTLYRGGRAEERQSFSARIQGIRIGQMIHGKRARNAYHTGADVFQLLEQELVKDESK